jgi:hypothetical protein
VKVHELIDLLQRCDPEAEVWTEGCDCDGESCSVGVSLGEVYIHRDLTGELVPPRLEAERVAALAEAEERARRTAEAIEAAKRIDPFASTDAWREEK